MMMTDANVQGRANPRGFRLLVCMAVLSGLWLAAASRVHVNASTSDGAWGYFALPLMGAPGRGDLVHLRPAGGCGIAYPLHEEGARPAGRAGGGGRASAASG